MASHFPKGYVPPQSTDDDVELGAADGPALTPDPEAEPRHFSAPESELEETAEFEPLPEEAEQPPVATPNPVVAPSPVTEPEPQAEEPALPPEIQPDPLDAADDVPTFQPDPLEPDPQEEAMNSLVAEVEVAEDVAPAEAQPQTKETEQIPAPQPDPLPEAAEDPAAARHDADAKKRKRLRRGVGIIISNLLIIVGIAMMATAGGIYVHNQRNYQRIDEENERVAEYAKLSDTDDTPPEVAWDELKAMNEDVVGWLQIPGTVINYPVMQAKDNDFYLDHAPDKSNSIGGSVFLDFEATPPGMVDAHTIIYGHHMRNGSQFKQVADMDDQMVFDSVRTVWYITEKGNYNLAPLFLYYTNADDTDVRQFNFADADAWHNYLKEYLNKAVARRADAEDAIKEVKHILALSTCNYYDGYGRTILVCAPKSEIPGTDEYAQMQVAQSVEVTAEQEREPLPAEGEQDAGAVTEGGE